MDVWHALEGIVGEVVHKRVIYWFILLILVDMLTRNHQNLLVRNVQSATELELLVQALLHNVVFVPRLEVLPGSILVNFFLRLNVINDQAQIFVHDKTTCILV